MGNLRPGREIGSDTVQGGMAKILRFRIFAVPLFSFVKENIGVWRSWLAHLLWEQGVPRSSRGTPTGGLMTAFSFRGALPPMIPATSDLLVLDLLVCGHGSAVGRPLLPMRKVFADEGQTFSGLLKPWWKLRPGPLESCGIMVTFDYGSFCAAGKNPSP